MFYASETTQNTERVQPVRGQPGGSGLVFYASEITETACDLKTGQGLEYTTYEEGSWIGPKMPTGTLELTNLTRETTDKYVYVVQCPRPME